MPCWRERRSRPASHESTVARRPGRAHRLFSDVSGDSPRTCPHRAAARRGQAQGELELRRYRYMALPSHGRGLSPDMSVSDARGAGLELAVVVVDGVVDAEDLARAATRRPCCCPDRPPSRSSHASTASGSAPAPRSGSSPCARRPGPPGSTRGRPPRARARRPDRASVGAPAQHEQPLLLRMLVVVRADALAGIEVVHRAAELLRADRRAEARHPRPVAGRIRLVALAARRRTR